ncbi:uncharacterized protein A1O9_05852 [Exophiala aquamarina CBS 119918]|uniref:Major facilitator superfamily (MFS) profile domain-containing protein n=1 Tax=Exophiala aquamarina CBS 119918 TaxID=1182545 RepID=A0A072PQY5_9EURO|nr:uncharacterized protein A1O9_05852 [Exophiala aquamarina CBS 119918]KEF57930.1 hypothetical protein A1O9_05852 [Exophiala aquamarina CBS 119918]
MAPSPQSSVENEDDKFPAQQLFVLGLCRFAEPIAFTSILAYIYVFVQDVRTDDEANAAFYAGLMVSAFALAEACTAMSWGSLSDRIGRKPVVLFGLAGTALSSLVFGFAKNYWLALGARVIGGLLNGNVAVIQTMVAEMCKRPEHERGYPPSTPGSARADCYFGFAARAYSVMPFVWSAGSIIGSAMGGYLAQPAKNYPSVFPPGGLFGQYPYLLPNLVAAIYIALTILVGAIFLKETNVPVRAKAPVQGASPTASPDERTPLRSSRSTEHARRGNEPDMASINTNRRPSLLGTNMPLTTGTTADLRRISTISASTAGGILPIFPDTNELRRNSSAISDDEDEESSTSSSSSSPWTREVRLLIIQLILMAYYQMAYSSLLPVFFIDVPDCAGLDFRGGLGYTVRNVGTFLSVNGFASLVIQGFIFAPFVGRVGVWKSFIWLTILVPLTHAAVPFLTALSGTALVGAIYVDLIMNNFCLIVIYPCLLILLKNATPSSSMLGQVNGLAMAASSGARTFAPPLAGFLYSKGGSAAGWWSIAAVGILSGLVILPMTPPRNDDGSEA